MRDAVSRREILTKLPALSCLVAAILFGVSTPMAKLLLHDSGPFTLSGLLYIGAALAVLPFARPLRSLGECGRVDRWRLGGVVLFGGMLAPVLLFFGLRTASAGTVSLWLNLETALTAVLAAAFFREHLGRGTWSAVAVVSAASLLLVWPASPGTAAAALLVSLACACWAIDNNLTGLIDGITPAQATLVKGLIAGALNLAIGLGWENGHGSMTTVAAALAVGAVCYGLSLVLHITGAQHLGAARAQTIFGTAPFWGVAVSWIALAEPWTAAQLGAGGLMAYGLWLTQREDHGHTHTHAAMAHVHWHRHDDRHHEHPHRGAPAFSWHIHPHEHEEGTHSHSHVPDVHHRHTHRP